MDRNLALEMVRVTEAAALSSSRMMGRGDRKAADQAAVDAMRRAFDSVEIRGTVVIGEGERDEAPMLYIGERVGSGWNRADSHAPKVDIAVDPLEGTNLCATGQPDSIAVIAVADDGQFLNAPDTYMNKIVVGPWARGAIDLKQSPSWNLSAVAEAKRCSVSDLTVVILERDRHTQLIDEVRKSGARIRLISDGDVAPAVAATQPDSGIDLLMGIGGAPEGVLAAAAVRCMGGDMQGELRFRNDDEVRRAERMGIKDKHRVYHLEDLAQGQVMFAATGVTDGSLLRGVRFLGGAASTHSVVMRSKSGTIRFIEARHHIGTKPGLEFLRQRAS
ncbi:MAG TPA: class II fructose-bisphosphatase [Pseudomonadota bacterium]|jgi:fructose-1,6-bisphosphatase II|nr:class II fructose-bisphosphatase [Pseudomonadota bacterium]